MGQSSLGFNADEDYEDELPGASALPASAQARASDSLQNPNFQLAAASDPVGDAARSAEATRAEAALGGGIAANPQPNSSNRSDAPQNAQALPSLPAQFDQNAEPPASPQSAIAQQPAGSAPVDNSDALSQGAASIPRQRQPVKQIGQIPIIDDTQLLQRYAAPPPETAAEAEQQHAAWMQLAQQSQAQQQQIARINQGDPYISDEDGRWKKQTADPVTGAIHESDIFDTGSGKIDRGTGNIYVPTSQGPQVIGVDPQQKQLAQMVEQKGQAQAQGSPISANIAAARSALLATQRQLQSFQGIPERISAQVAKYTQASLDPSNTAAVAQLQSAQAALNNWKQQNPRYTALCARRDALANQIQTQLAAKAQNDLQVAQLLTTPQYATWNGNLPPWPGVASQDAQAPAGPAAASDISTRDLDARAGVIAAQTGFPAGLAYVSALGEAQKRGAQAVDGSPIEDAIQGVQPVAQAQLPKMTPAQLQQAFQSGLITQQQARTAAMGNPGSSGQDQPATSPDDGSPTADPVAQGVAALTAKAADLRTKIQTAFDTGGADGVQDLATYRAALPDTESQLHAATQTLMNRVPAVMQQQIVKAVAPDLDWDAATLRNAQDPMAHFATENLGSALRDQAIAPDLQQRIRRLAISRGVNPDLADHVANQAVGATAVSDLMGVLQGRDIDQGRAETLQDMGFLQQSDPSDPASPLHLTEDAQRLLTPGGQRFVQLKPDLARYTPSPDPAHGSVLYQNAIAGTERFSNTAERMHPALVPEPETDGSLGNETAGQPVAPPAPAPNPAGQTANASTGDAPPESGAPAIGSDGERPANNGAAQPNDSASGAAAAVSGTANTSGDATWTSGVGVFPESKDLQGQGDQPTPEENLALARQGKKLYSYDDKTGVSFSQERMADGLNQAVQDGIVDPQWAQAHQQQFQNLQDKYNALKQAAGSDSSLKAILHGGGIGAAFWAGSLPGAKYGAAGASMIPGVGETGVAQLVGGALGGLTTGSIAAWAAHNALDKLADYSQAVKSLNASAELHPVADAAGQLIGMSLNAPKALMNLTNAARLAAEAGTTVDAMKMVAKAAGVGAATGAAFEGGGRPLFDVAKNAVLDQLGIGHDAVQPPTIGSLITNAALGIITAGHDLRLNGYSPEEIASIMSRAKIRSDAGIPLGVDDAPAVAAAFQQRGVNIDGNHPMTRPLSEAEQAVYDALARKNTEIQQSGELNESTKPNPKGDPLMVDQSPSSMKRAENRFVAGGIFPNGLQDDPVRFHHPFPMYLGGHFQQILEPLPKSIHDAYHKALDTYLPRGASKAFYDSMPPDDRSLMLQKLGAYTKAFDVKNGTNLFDAMTREGFATTP
jgi:hypothetical protein